MKKRLLMIVIVLVLAVQGVACSADTDERETGEKIVETVQPEVSHDVKTKKPVNIAPSKEPTKMAEATQVPTLEPTQEPELTLTPTHTPKPTIDGSKELDSINSVDELENIIETDIDATIENLEAEWETLIGKIENYAEYKANIKEVEAFYGNVYEKTQQVCSRMQNYSVRYGEIILDLGISTDDMYDKMDGIYDAIYSDALDEVYDEIYSGILDDMYDEIYGEVLDEAYDTVTYAEWAATRSTEYGWWKDTRSEVYDLWKDSRSEIYDLWKDVRGELWDDDLENAKEELLEYKSKLTEGKEDTNNKTDDIVSDKEKTKKEETEANKPTQETETAGTNTDGYFEYRIIDGKYVEITRYKGSEETVTIPSTIAGEDVTHIGKGAFENCTSIKNLIIWPYIEVIGENAFKGCTSLEEISISSDNEMIGKSAFENCTSLETVIFWSGEAIGDNAFKGCTSLEEISIPSDVEIIGKSAFENCTELDELIIWGTETIGESAFKGCISLEEISIPSDTKTIGDYAFYGCTELEEVIIWSNETELGKEVFGNCPNLKKR